MITYIAQVINLLISTVQFVLLCASLTGKLIVAVISWISSILLTCGKNVGVFLQIVYEDNISIFTEDLPNASNEIINTVTNQIATLQHVVLLLYNGFIYKFGTILGTIKWSLDAAILIISEVLFLIKKTVIFVGDTIWLILTFVPVHLPQLIKVLFRHVFDVIAEVVVAAYMRLLKVTNFLTDVPLESLIGIVSAIVTIRLCIHFKESIVSHMTAYYWSSVRLLWYYYYAFYNYFIDTEVREIGRMSNGEDVGSREQPLDDDVDDVIDDGNADTLCVICQERPKRVLTLPCKHVCLCTECCMRLYGYQRTCPICRTFIYQSVTVYL